MERVMSTLANYLIKDSNLDIYLILYGINREQFYKVDPRIKIYIPPFEFTNEIRIISTILTLFYLRACIIKLKPTVVLSFGELWNNFVLLSLLNKKINTIVSDRCNPNKSLGRLHNFLRNWLYPKASLVLVQTQKAKNIYAKNIKNINLKVVGNPIRVIDNGNIPPENIILSVGRFIESKKFDELIEIFANLQVNNWKLVIIGADDQKQHISIKLKKLIVKYNLQNNIVLNGTTTQIEEWYQKASIFAFTSVSEGFPNVIGEAMSAGLPVIAYDCIAGPSEMIEDNKSGFLIPLNDKDTFIEKLKLLILDEQLRTKMGIEGRKKIQAFEEENICDLLKKILLDESITN